MFSRTSFSLPTRFSTRLKEVFQQDKLIRSAVIPQDIEFSGFYIDNFIVPRIRVEFYESTKTTLMHRTDSESPRTNHKNIATKTNINPSIWFDSLFASGNDLKVLLKAENSIDNSVLFQYISYEWSNERLWSNKFKYIFKMDLSVMLRSDFFTPESSSLSTDKLIAKIIYKSMDNPQSIDESEILKHIINNDKMSKTLILCDGVGKIVPLINFSSNSPHHSYSRDTLNMFSVLKCILRYPKIILNSNNHVAEILKKNFNFDIILENTGFLKSDFKQYIKVHFSGTPQEHLLLDFIEHNYHIQAIHSPCILKMICYVLTRSDGLNLKSIASSATLTSLYYDMLSLMSRNFVLAYGETYKKNAIYFMQELAFKSITDKKFSVETLIESYSIVGENILDLVTSFKLIKYEYTALDGDYRYSFKDSAFRDFLAASYLRKLLLSQDKDNIEIVISFISNNQEKLEFLRVIKFLSGLITLISDVQEKKEVMIIFWKAVNSNPTNEIRIDGNNKLEFIMEILSQNILDGKVDLFVPKEILDKIDTVIIKDIANWKDVIIKSQYSSDKIFDFLLRSLDSEDIKISSVAISILPFLNIRNKLNNELIANKLIEIIKSSDSIAIIEPSIRALQYLDDIPAVEAFLQELLANNRMSIVLVAIEVIGNLAELSYLKYLTDKLKDNNPLVISTTLEAIKKITHGTIEQENFKEIIVNILSLPQIHHKLVVNKAIDLFNRMYIEPEVIIKNIMQGIASSVYQESIDYLSSLKEVINYGIKFNYDQVCVILLKKIVQYNRLFHRYTLEEYKITTRVTEIFGDIFYKINVENKNNICSFLKNQLSINNEETKIATIYVLGKIADYDVTIIPLIEEKMTNSQYISAEVASINIIKEKFSSFTERHKLELINQIVVELKKSHDASFIIAALRFISETYKQVNHVPRNNFINSILNDKKYPGDQIRIEILKLIVNNIKNFDQDLRYKSFTYIQRLFFLDICEEIRFLGIQVLGILYKYLPHKDEIIELLLADRNFKSAQLKVKLEITNSFEEIILGTTLAKQINLISMLQDRLQDPTYIYKIFIIKSLSKFKIAATHVSQSLGEALINQILQGSNKLMISSMECLIGLYKSELTIMQNILNKFITTLSIRAGNDFNYKAEKASIYAIGEILSSVNKIDNNYIERSVTILMKEINSSSDLAEMSLIALNKFIFMIPQNKLDEIVDRLIVLASNGSLNFSLVEIIADILGDLIRNDKLSSNFKDNSIRIIFNVINNKVNDYNREYLVGNKDLIDELIIKYLSDDILTSIEDTEKIETYLEVIFLRALTTGNSIIRQNLFHLLHRFNIDVNKLFYILEYNLESYRRIEDKLQIIKLVRNNFIFKDSDDFSQDEFLERISSLEDRINRNIMDVFDSTGSILISPITFATYALENGLDVRMNSDSILIDGKIYPMETEDFFYSSYNNAKKIFTAFKTLNNNIALSKRVEHLFSPITGNSLKQNNVQFSILHQVTNVASGGSLIDIILVFEESTIFGYNIIKVIKISDSQLSVSYHKTIDINFKQNIFGEPSEYFSYYVKSISIKNEDAAKLTDLELSMCDSYLCLIDKVRLILGENSELDAYYARTWREGTLVSHNYLIAFDGYRVELASIRNRQNNIEIRLKDLEIHVLELTKDIVDIKLSQDSLKELTLFIHKVQYASDDSNFTPYEAAVARRIMFELDALYIFAKVVHKDRVANAQTGAAGSIAKLFSAFSGYVSIAKPAVDLIASFLSSYDANIQARIVANIAKFAPTGGKAEVMINNIANSVAKGKINLDRLPKETLYEKIFSAITAIPDLQDIVIDKMVDFFVSKIEKSSPVDDEIERGNVDGEKVANIFIALISAGKCDEVNWEKNENILLNYIQENGLIDLPVIEFSPMIMAPGITRCISITSENLALDSDNQHNYDYKNNFIEWNIDPINYNHEIALAGGTLMKAAEVWPATNYLLTHWLPIIPLMDRLGFISDFLSDNKQNIATAFYSIGAATITYAVNGNPYVALSASILFYAKPFIYQQQNRLLEYIYSSKDTDGYVKFGLYVATESVLTIVSIPLITDPYSFITMLINNPISFVSDPITKMGLMQGAFIGATKYLSHFNIKDGNILGDIIAFPIPLAMAYQSYQQILVLSDSAADMASVHIILLAANTVSKAAIAHYGAKVIGDIVQDQIINYLGENNIVNDINA